MDDAPRILLIDDGELDALPPILDALEIPFTRVLAGGDPISPPLELVIASPRRASRVRRGSPAGARSGRPLRIIAVEEDTAAMRRLLQRLGFQLLVRQPAHPDVWRLLIQRALYEGAERRGQDRIPVGSDVELRGADASGEQSGEAFLVDISNRGCRVLCEGALELEEPIEIRVDLSRFGAGELDLRGSVVRAEADTASDGRPITSAGVLFDPDLPERSRRQLAMLLNRFTAGPGSLVTLGPDDALPPAESSEFPGFTLDAETDPAVAANLSVQLHSQEGRRGQEGRRQEDGRGEEERREAPRARFGTPLLAREGERQRVLLGRDLSTEGMRVGPTPGLSEGQCFRLALYGPGDPEPTRVDARVARCDDEDGWMLAFESVDTGTRRQLEKIVACLPGIAAHDDAPDSGQLLSEILEDSEALD